MMMNGSKFFHEYFLPNWDALNEILAYSKEKPFIFPVEALLGIAFIC
ncbi:Uncharacterised protein [Klebsiella michiganensis]|uniref:Uncharacterized protein n=1 Tax=Klebsiella michiganensis TaxID=1134687 RepID=A0A7H4PMA4_9ENTR|nr:Uncharacterised protein [Klebsiella michiganensis]